MTCVFEVDKKLINQSAVSFNNGEALMQAFEPFYPVFFPCGCGYAYIDMHNVSVKQV
ncbi:MAG: hypothetical protein KDC99_19325 [Cyclobacteriaceae bacterium]|nr:hypothetical protein [Cyclobacteriaceae bacterium]